MIARQAALVLVFISAVLIGMTLAVAGCKPCPEPAEPLGPSTWTVVESHIPDLIDAVVEVEDEEVTVSYSRSDGTRWVVTYDVTDRT